MAADPGRSFSYIATSAPTDEQTGAHSNERQVPDQLPAVSVRLFFFGSMSLRGR